MSAFDPLQTLGIREILRWMKWSSLVTLTVLGGCSGHQPDAARIAQAQAKSWYGPTADWKLDPALRRADIQKMRDSAYRFCRNEKRSDEKCFMEQDHSLVAFANSYQLVRIFRSEREPEFPFAIAHKQNPAAFNLVRGYCYSLYKDHGSRDARFLGPCMSAGVGADFFSVVPVP